MSSLLYFWLGAGIIFLIVEMITATFYGLSLALAAFAVAGYVYLTHDIALSLIQWILFAVISALCSYFLPSLFTRGIEDHPQGLDIYLSETRKVKQSGEDFKVTLDGVDYFIDIEDVKPGDKVKLTSRKGSIFHGEIV